MASEEPTIFTMLTAKRNKLMVKGKNFAQPIDNRIQSMYVKNRAVVVFEIHDQPKILRGMGELGFMDLIIAFKFCVEKQIEANHGKSVESVATKIIGQVFCLFDDVNSALISGLAVQQAVASEFGEMFEIKTIE